MITLKTFERTPSLAELKVSYRRSRPKGGEGGRPPFFADTPLSCEQYLRAVWDKDTLELREEFVVLCLNGAHEVLGWVKLHTGCYNETPVDVRMVLAVALLTASTAIIAAHNHPSGRLRPSWQDILLTEQLQAAGDLIGLHVLDHLILTRDGCYSFDDAGLLPKRKR